MKTPETKTLLQWINGLPEKVRQKAISNFQRSEIGNDILHKQYPNLKEALENAFIWDVFEGFEFWEEIILKHS